MDRVSLGIPAYGRQSKDWWGPLVRQAAELYKQQIELVNVHVTGSMMTDQARNHIVADFLKTDAEWLRFLDADNVDKMGSIRRLLDTRKTLVTGIYTKRNESGEPIAYFATEEGYQHVGQYNPGEIIPIEAAGMGGLLVHRSVFGDIQANYRMFNLIGGGVVTVHKDDIQGDVFDDDLSETDGKVVDGVLHQRLRQMKLTRPFAFFMLQFGRTEDYGFFEMAARSGHKLWLDTGVEIGHIGEHTYKPADVRVREIKALQEHYYEALPWIR
jgi:hypothetical protein